MNDNHVTTPPPTPLHNGMTPERWAQVLDYIRESNNDPEDVERRERAFAEAQKVREQINEEARRQLDEEEGK